VICFYFIGEFLDAIVGALREIRRMLSLTYRAIKQSFDGFFKCRATFADNFDLLGLAHLGPRGTVDGRLRHPDQSLLVSH
jgi:hypothetical protein